MAVHYYDEDDIKINRLPAGEKASVSSPSKPVELTEEDKKAAHDRAIARLAEEQYQTLRKKNIRKKEQFPNEDSLDRFTCAIASDYNKQFESRQMKGFSKCSYKLQQLFEERYGSKG